MLMNQRCDPVQTWRRSSVPMSESGIVVIAGLPAIPPYSCPKKPIRGLAQRGAGLIEVMVALLVLAIGLLGFAAMQTQGISQGQKAYLHSQAIFAAQDMVERMRANTVGLDSYTLSFSDSASSSTNCSSSACNPVALAAWDKSQWLALLDESLPMGDGQIQLVSTGTPTVVLISVRYRLNRDLDATDQSANKNVATEYVYELRAQI